MSRTRNKKDDERILNMLRSGMYASKIAGILKISRMGMSKKLKRMEDEGLIKSSGNYPKFYTVTNKAKSAKGLHLSPPVKATPTTSRKQPLTEQKIRLHDFKVKIPITTMGQKLKNEKTININNWVKRYYEGDLPVDAKLEITTKSAIIHFYETDIPRSLGFSKAISEFAISGCAAVASFLGLHGYKLDFQHPKVISQHLASKTSEEVDKQVAEGTTFKIMMSYNAKSITGDMTQTASAWVDKSKGLLEIETNDMLYEKMLLEMPLRMVRLQDYLTKFGENISKYDENISKHLEVLNKMEKSLDDLSTTMKLMQNSLKKKKPLT